AREPETHPLRELVLGEEDLELLGESVGVDHLAFVEQARHQALGGRAAQERRAASRELCGGQEAGLDVKPYDRPRLWLCECETQFGMARFAGRPGVLSLA